MGLASKVNSGAGGAPPAPQQQGGQPGGMIQSAGRPGGPPGASAYPSAPQQQQSQFPGQPGAQGQQLQYPGQPGAPGQQSQYPGQQGAPGQLPFPGQQGAPGQQSQYPGQQGGQSQFPGPQGGPGQQSHFPGQQQLQQPGGQRFGGPGAQGSFAGAPQSQQSFGGPQSNQSFGAAPSQQSYGGQPQQGHGRQVPGGANAQYAGTHGLMGQPGSAGSVMPVIKTKLTNMVTTNHLQAFFPQGLNRVFERLDCVNFAGLSQKWDMPLELATDLAQLALYDIVIFADDSGSMVFEERGERIDDLKLILGRVAEVATLFDDDGILVRFMNSSVEGNGIRSPEAAIALVQQIQFNGMTPLGTNLNSKVIQPFLMSGIQRRDLAKPILCVVITDGEPVGEAPGTVKRVIVQAKQAASQSAYGPGAIAFQFAQVGKDVKAQRFLGELDNDPEVGMSIDATSYYELEAEEYANKGVTLTPELWLCKLMLGAIDPSYDEQDE